MKRLIFLLLSIPLFLQAIAQHEWQLNTALPGKQKEVRAVWLTTLSGLDWPRKTATTAAGAAEQKRELCDILDRLQQAGINTILFQTRIRSTTAYPSAIEPWDGAFTGTPGRAPLYDPLAFALEECHKRNMELHAWVVAFPICKTQVEKKLGKKSLPQKRPELCQRCGDQWMMDPGVPGTDKYLADICREIVKNYDVDGIHLDYIRYPERGIAFNDNRTYNKYGKKKSKAAWRKENVTRCVKAIHKAVKDIRPWVKLSCSPIGKYADLRTQSSYGWNARDAVHQDVQAWLRDGLMDMIFPMMYFDGKHFYPFAINWKENSYGKPVVPGLGIYFLSEKEKDWHLNVIRRQLNFLRQEELGGQAYFRSKFLTDNTKGIYDFVCEDFYHQPAQLPAMVWVDKSIPQSPKVQLQLKKHTLHLNWNAVADETPIYYNIYRIGENDTLLIAHRLRTTEFTYTPALPHLLYEKYAVTAVDAYGNESPLASQQLHMERHMPAAVSDYVELPEEESAEYALVTDIFGRHVLTCRYDRRINVKKLDAGCYEVRTLGAKGTSHKVAFFRKL